MLLRTNLLSGRALALAGPVREPLAEAAEALGARVETLALGGADETALEAWARERVPLHGLIYDAGPAFAGGGEGPLQTVLEQAWAAVRGVAVGALIDGDGGAAVDVSANSPGGKIVLVAPPAGAGPLAEALAAALESLARTLSVEWARHRITATAVVPGPSTEDEQLAELVGFLVSPAGDYFSGCRFDLGGFS